MKKIILTILCIFLMLGMSGCGHTSNSELVDIEQFRCQDSIQTVFDILGETEMNEYDYTSIYSNEDYSSYIYYEKVYNSIFAEECNLYYYRYDNINLFGFDGSAVFDVRHDEETIQEFYCALELNKKEFEELISYFSEKYGSYVMDDFGDTIKLYEWSISEENGKIGYEEDETGYDEIIIQDRGEGVYVVFWGDEWSFIKDEEYYEAVEKSQENQEESITIAEGEYDICGDSLRLVIIQKGDEHELLCYADTKTKENANVLTTWLYAFCEQMKELFDNYGVHVSYENGGSIIVGWTGNTYIKMGTNADGSATLSTPDWYTGEISMSESEYADYTKALATAWSEFADEIEKNIN